MTTLAQMFPLLSRSQIQSVLLQCGGDITATVDQLLVGDLVDREMNMQDQATSYRTLCNLWVKGKCRGGRASACKERHFYTDDDSKISSQAGWGGEVRVSRFSSPYKARVVMERVEVVREQINLESGQEETVSEIQGRVFVDLTGSVGEDFA